MKVWIEQCAQSGHGISWEVVASLLKEAQRNGDNNLTEREINLAYGLKDKQASILINHSNIFFANYILMYMLTFSLYGINMHLIINIVLFHVLLHKD